MNQITFMVFFVELLKGGLHVSRENIQLDITAASFLTGQMPIPASHP